LHDADRYPICSIVLNIGCVAVEQALAIDATSTREITFFMSDSRIFVSGSYAASQQ